MKTASVNFTVVSFTEPGIILGTVTDKNDSTQIAGATIKLMDGSRVVNSTSTLPNGSYILRNVAPDIPYVVVAGKDGYKNASQGIRLKVGGLSRIDLKMLKKGTGGTEEGGNALIYGGVAIVVVLVIVAMMVMMGLKRKKARDAKKPSFGTFQYPPGYVPVGTETPADAGYPPQDIPYQSGSSAAAPATPAEPAPAVVEQKLSLEDEIKRLDSLRQKGLITDDEYSLSKQRLMKKSGK
jgi:hypothetical protein